MRGPLDWRIPLVILLLLAIASATRWQTEATFRYSNVPIVVCWKRDRWTNTRWVAVYGYEIEGFPGTYREEPLTIIIGTVPMDTERAKILVAIASLVWRVLVLVDILWLLIALIAAGVRRRSAST
ncbi:hypothetical protein HRbin16_00339 [bacterium HR16]|nr:hypothetical protein HRbin16_00339 [bacterium HR16]